MLRSLLSVPPIALAALAALARSAAAQGVPERPEQAAPAALPVQPGKLVFRYAAENNKRMLGRNYSSHRQEGVQVVLQLLAGGKLHVEETGSRIAGSYNEGHSESDSVSWKNGWDGTWAARSDALQLSLTISERECSLTRTQQRRGGPEKTESLLCQPVSLEARVTCRLLPDQVHPLATKDGQPEPKPQPQLLWHCEPPEPAGSRLSELNRAWVFAQRGCLAEIYRDGYRACPPWP